MAPLSVAEARKRLFALGNEEGESHAPVGIHGERCHAVLVTEEDWQAIQETLYFFSITGMRKSILEGMAAPESALSETPGW
jgi:antitoxin YefM